MMHTERLESAISVEAAVGTWGRLADVSPSPQLDCQVLMAHMLGVSRSWLYSHGDILLTGEQQARFEVLMSRRLAGEPVAYITGQRAFWKMELRVTSATLVPRPETELLVEATLERLDNARRTVVDAGTGTGAIAIALAMERPRWTVYATDNCPAALAVAADNAGTWADGRIGLIHADWLAPFGASTLDAIICNPPYVREKDEHLEQLGYEPPAALVAGADGLDAITRIVSQSTICLRPGGRLMLEHGFDQRDAVTRLLDRAGLVNIEALTDYGGQPRVLIAQKDPGQ